jgi:hypothetical protein
LVFLSNSLWSGSSFLCVGDYHNITAQAEALTAWTPQEKAAVENQVFAYRPDAQLRSNPVPLVN